MSTFRRIAQACAISAAVIGIGIGGGAAVATATPAHNADDNTTIPHSESSTGGSAVISNGSHATVTAATARPQAQTADVDWPPQFFCANGVRIHTAPSISAYTAGLGFYGQWVIYYVGNPVNRNGWAGIKDEATGVAGWVQQRYLCTVSS